MELDINFIFEKFSKIKDKFYPGDSGDDCIIIVYDTIIDTLIENEINYNDSKIINFPFDKIICYSILNTGKSNNLGSITSCLYGLICENKDIILLLGDNKKY